LSFSVVLLKGGNVVQTIGTHTPFLSAVNTSDFDAANPPRLTAIHKTITIKGVLFGKDSTAKANYDALVAQFENAASYPDGLQLKDGSGVVVLDLAGHDYFKIESLALPESDRQWRNELSFTIQVSAVRRFIRVVEGTSDTEISGLTLTESWSYDEAGLLTQTLEGNITTPQGTSAVAAARDLGLKLPSSSFGYVTNGQGGCNVEQEDEGDTKASFTSTIRQVGLPLPAGVGPSFSVSIETAIANGEKVTTTSVSGTGTGAEAAVKALLPAGAESSSVRSDKFQRTASATYVKREPAVGSVIIRSHSIVATGGERPIRYTQCSGGREPLEHVGTYQIIEIEESATVEIIGPPGGAIAGGGSRFKIPPSLAGVQGIREDRSRFRISAPYVTQMGRDASSHHWAIDVRRFYFATDFKSAYAAMGNATVLARSTGFQGTDPDKEVAGRNAGKAAS
jgi:hypothetical protein